MKLIIQFVLPLLLVGASLFPAYGQAYPPVKLEVSSAAAQTGDDICLDFRASNFQAILSIQFSIQWDTAVLRFVRPDNSGLPDIPDNGLNNNFGINSPFTAEGKLGFSYLAGDLINGTTLPDSSVLFSLCFEVIGPEGSSSPVNITSFPTGLEVIQEQAEGAAQVYEFEIAGATVIVGNGKAPPPVRVDILDRRCQEANPGFLEAVPRGGSPPYSYLWTQPNGETSDEARLFNIQPGSYRVEVIDARGANAVTQISLSLSRRAIILNEEAGCTFTEDGRYVPFVHITASGGHAPYQFVWNTGDTVKSDSSSRLLVEAAGTYYATVTDAGGCFRVDSVEVDRCEDNTLWPGDANADGQVDGRDLLILGLTYGATGPARPEAVLDWTAQPAPLWGEYTPESNVNFLHSDSDGNGRIEARDTLGLSGNWSKTNDKYAESRQPNDDDQSLIRSDNPSLYIATQSVAPGDSAVFDIILGESGQRVEKVYGLSFRIYYDSPHLARSSPGIVFRDSWFGKIGTDAWAMQFHDPADRFIDIAITGIDRQNRRGNGPIGQLLVGVDGDAPEHDIRFRIDRVWMIDSAEQQLSVQPLGSLAEVRRTTALSNPSRQKQFRLFPNPAREVLFVQYDSANVELIELLNAGGQTLRRWKATNRLNLQGVPPGIYWLRMVTKEGIVSRKVIVQL